MMANGEEGIVKRIAIIDVNKNMIKMNGFYTPSMGIVKAHANTNCYSVRQGV